jgi:manganese/zinc/iron transport system ATP- binding protein
MKQAGKTVLIVHHDLHTAHQFFDWMVLLNTRLIKCGPTASVFTAEYLKQAYGGQLTILSQVSDLVKARDFPIRERSFKDQPK